MKTTTLTTVAASLFAAAPAFGQPVVMEWVTVGNAGNAADPSDGDIETPGIQNFGAVGYEYRIGTYEVTNAQYAAFLNSVAASDPNGLYSSLMGSDPRGGITRSGSAGSYTYSVRANMGNKPVIFVSWYDVARMANWMTNGQPAGLQSPSTTEAGVYTLTGTNSIGAITVDISNPDHIFIPNENEWYKAAYHQPASQGGDTDDYWLYATQSNRVPTIATATSTGDVGNPGMNVVNYNFGADWNGRDGNVTTVGSTRNTTFYGAFDMNGNVLEWNETLIVSDATRGLRGGSFFDNEFGLWSLGKGGGLPALEFLFVGFRLASTVPPDQPCPADFNGDTVGGDIFDLFDFLAALDGGLDFNMDTSPADIFDLFDFLAVLDAGCP